MNETRYIDDVLMVGQYCVMITVDTAKRFYLATMRLVELINFGVVESLKACRILLCCLKFDSFLSVACHHHQNLVESL